MSEKRSKGGPSGRFGARYGVRVRRRVDEIEEEQRQDHGCPECGAEKVNRVSTGIWRCRRCDHTFAGGAYMPTTQVLDLETVLEESPDELLEEID